MNIATALKQVRTQGKINITSGTKDGRGNHTYSQWRLATANTDIKGFHDLRAAYACERYQQITGSPAPVVMGERIATKAQDLHARTIIALELGHNRTNVLVAYVGSAK